MLPKRRRTAWVNVGWRDAGGGGVRDHRVCNHAIGSVGDRAVLIYIRTDRTLRLPDHRDSGTAVPGVRPSMTSCTAAFVTLRASFVPGFAQVIDTRLSPILTDRLPFLPFNSVEAEKSTDDGRDVRPSCVYLHAGSTGALLIGPIFVERTPSAASRPSHLHQQLQTIPQNLSV